MDNPPERRVEEVAAIRARHEDVNSPERNWILPAWIHLGQEANADRATLLARLDESRTALVEITNDRDDWKREWEMYARAWTRELGESGIITRAWNKTHQIDALVVVTQEVVAELKRLRTQTADLREKVNREYRASIGEVWHWLGDGTDDLDTLLCPVLIEPDVLQSILTTHAETIRRLEEEVREQAAKHADCCVDLEERDRLREALTEQRTLNQQLLIELSGHRAALLPRVLPR